MKLTHCKLLFGDKEIKSKDIVSIKASCGMIEIQTREYVGKVVEKYERETRYTVNLDDVEFVAD